MAVTITTNTNYVLPNVAAVAAQTAMLGRGPVQTVTFNATETFIDCTKGSQFELTLTGNVAALSAINPQDRQVISIRLIQDATGSRTVTWNSWVWHSGTAPTLTTTAAHYDLVQGMWNATTSKWENIIAPVLDLS